MGRPKGSTNKPKDETKEKALASAPVNTGDVPDVDTDEKEEKDPVEVNVRVIDPRGEWGIVYPKNTHNYVTLVHRNFYEVDTVGTKGRAVGKTYKAGTYSPWQWANSKYPANDRKAIEYVATILYNEKMDADADYLMSEVQAMSAVWAELTESFWANRIDTVVKNPTKEV